MLMQDYWRKELAAANRIAPPEMTSSLDVTPDPQIVAAILICQQLREINGTLEQIRVQLAELENQLANQ